ncbi:TlpA family protein disulfide reductase [Persicitalea jodogahamensis]|uniref:Thioredoxin n=1 Tax=Persicitalea jodogahamensis TaxID=402147 RepID=A0A8J3D9U0_9BACT|nr:TlpA disulfide reductase family protein [Persicitalea jodogahamensis]GHB71679.1 thioredoxin [Persicitalea jodogahamensis]
MKPALKYSFIALAAAVGSAAIYLSLRDTPSTDSEVAMESVADSPASANDPNSVYLTLSDLKGNMVAMDTSKLTFINVWATWCGPCNAEMPSIQSLYERYRDNPKMAFYIVSDEAPATVQNFLQKKNYELPFYLLNGDYPGPLSGNAIPRTYMVRNGQVLAEQVGAVNWNDPQIFKFIDEQLAM